jgi:S1-C subfamily serine protease
MKQLFYNKNTGDRIQNTMISYVLYTLSCILIILSFAGLLNIYDKETETAIVLGKASYTPYQDEYEKMLYPTVRISTPSGTGSGVVIEFIESIESKESNSKNSKDSTNFLDCYILTAAHVVGNESVVKVEAFSDAGYEIRDASVVITDTSKDLALIRVIHGIRVIGVDNIYYAHLAPKDYTPYIFTPVYTVGCSLGLPPRPSQGIISVVEQDHWEVTSPILPGNSGGPVYDGHTYEVIGIAVWVKVYQYQLVTTMVGIVPINQVYEFLNNIQEFNSSNVQK